ncbi:uncharacterized protein TNCT_17201 [Trichonephila clavata]|uniref:Uncharacterized protein n=1 Tax=Trichonephila clavata TaxID=2740835 RepID=A0A8X6HZ73_TRICU|nr:uncharacterized protein TNCT_17201 [Trichonephila clavata]
MDDVVVPRANECIAWLSVDSGSATEGIDTENIAPLALFQHLQYCNFLYPSILCCSTSRMKESPLLSREASYWHATEFFCEHNLRFLYWPYWNYIGGRSHRHRCQNPAEVPWDH